MEILISSTYSMSYIYKLCHVVNGWVKIQNLQHANSGCKYRIYNIAYEADTKLVLYIHKLYKAEQYKHTSSQCLRMAKMYDSLLFFFWRYSYNCIYTIKPFFLSLPFFPHVICHCGNITIKGLCHDELWPLEKEDRESGFLVEKLPGVLFRWKTGHFRP